MKCYFENFAPVIAICRPFEKFEMIYTKALKKSLGLPLQTPNLPLIKALGIPSLQQIAVYHVITNCEIIKERFQKLPESLRLSSQSLCVSLPRVSASLFPESLRLSSQSLGPQAEAYSELRSTPIVTRISHKAFRLDLLADRVFLDKCLLGLVAGTFLNLRSPAGAIQDCPKCKVQRTQSHFLNVCPSNTAPRSILARSLPPNFRAKRVKEGNFALFYGEIREVEVEIVGDLCEEDPIPEEVYRNFGRAAMEMANLFTVNALKLFQEDENEG